MAHAAGQQEAGVVKKIRTWKTTIGAQELGDREVVCVLPETWRRIMAVVRAADYWDAKGIVMPEVGALYDYLEKK